LTKESLRLIIRAIREKHHMAERDFELTLNIN